MTTPKKKPAKKKPAKKAPPRDLTKAEAFFVESHYGAKSAGELAKELGVPLDSIQVYLDCLEKAGFEQKTPKTLGEKAGFAERQGTVSMTPAASELGDRMRGITFDGENKPKPRNDEFFKRRVPGIHIINPNLPVR